MRSRKIKIIVLAIAFIAVFVLGGIVSWAVFSPVSETLVGQETPERYKEIDFSKFWAALDAVKKDYIGNVDYNNVVEGAIAGMVASLEDPFSAYINPKEMSMFEGEINGTFEGIGAEISVKDGQLTVIAPLEGSPSEKPGIKAGDVIEEIDGENVGIMTVDDAIGKIRGKKGTWVVLSISRNKNEQPLKIKVKRDTIKVKSVEYKMLDGNIAYIKILRFDNSTKTYFEKYASQLTKSKAKGLILDLRNNPGGYLDSAADIASEFIKDGDVAIEEFKDKKQEKISASGQGKLFDLPLVVLVNQGSASGSEIVAGAIQDRERGVLVGQKTFGKGTVQELQPISGGGAIKITVAKWLTPKGHDIQKNGLSPDIAVEWDGTGTDIQLERAVQEMKQLTK